MASSRPSSNCHSAPPLVPPDLRLPDLRIPGRGGRWDGTPCSAGRDNDCLTLNPFPAFSERGSVPAPAIESHVPDEVCCAADRLAVYFSGSCDDQLKGWGT
jgi:hypothetical protein